MLNSTASRDESWQSAFQSAGTWCGAGAADKVVAARQEVGPQLVLVARISRDKGWQTALQSESVWACCGAGPADEVVAARQEVGAQLELNARMSGCP